MLFSSIFVFLISIALLILGAIFGKLILTLEIERCAKAKVSVCLRGESYRVIPTENIFQHSITGK